MIKYFCDICGKQINPLNSNPLRIFTCDNKIHDYGICDNCTSAINKALLNNSQSDFPSTFNLVDNLINEFKKIREEDAKNEE